MLTILAKNTVCRFIQSHRFRLWKRCETNEREHSSGAREGQAPSFAALPKAGSAALGERRIPCFRASPVWFRLCRPRDSAIEPPDNEPQPDIALLRAEYRLRAALPAADDVLLIVEVTDSTLDRDRDVKIPLYARNGIPEAWLLDVKSERATIYRDPRPEGYQTVLSAGPDATISPLLNPDVSISLPEIWPARPG